MNNVKARSEFVGENYCGIKEKFIVMIEDDNLSCKNCGLLMTNCLRE